MNQLGIPKRREGPIRSTLSYKVQGEKKDVAKSTNSDPSLVDTQTSKKVDEETTIRVERAVY